MNGLSARRGYAWALLGAALLGACGPCLGPIRGPVDGTLTGSGLHGLEVADALEALIARRADSQADRQYAYQRVSREPVVTAQDALARAIVAGRLTQISGFSATSLVAEVERYARSSAALDPDFRSGAAQRLLGTLYVMAPAALLEHGDSEVGLELLESLAQRFPAHLPNRLRLAEAYLALDDPEPARPHLCHCSARRSELRPDERKLLDDLLVQGHVEHCP